MMRCSPFLCSRNNLRSTRSASRFPPLSLFLETFALAVEVLLRHALDHGPGVLVREVGVTFHHRERLVS